VITALWRLEVMISCVCFFFFTPVAIRVSINLKSSQNISFYYLLGMHQYEHFGPYRYRPINLNTIFFVSFLRA